jgi:hypothetical protein
MIVNIILKHQSFKNRNKCWVGDNMHYSRYRRPLNPN